jgi:hypothetical protein
MALGSRPRTDPLNPPVRFSARWWLAPLELRAASRLPRVDADLLAVTASPDGKRVFVAGRHGTILASDDGGLTWAPERVVAPTPPAPTKETEAKTPPASPPGVAEGEAKKGARPVQKLPPDVPSARRETRPVVAPSSDDNSTSPNPAVPHAIPPAGNAPTRQTAPPAPPKDLYGPKPASKKATKASLDLLHWLVPEAHAAEPPAAPPPVEQQAPAAPSASDPPGGASTDYAADLIGVATLPLARFVASSATGETFSVVEPRTSTGETLVRGGARVWRSSGTSPLRYWSRGTQKLVSSADIGGDAIWLLSGGSLIDVATANYRLAGLENVRAVGILRQGNVKLAVAGDRVWRLQTPLGRWEPLGERALTTLRGLYFLDERRGWVVGEGGEVLRTTDAGAHWASAEARGPVPLNGVYFLEDGRGWIVGNDGFIGASEDGGASFVARTRLRSMSAAGAPLTLPPPWYFAIWGLAFGLFFVGRSIPAAKEAETARAVEPTFASDRPLEKGEPDVLGLAELASGLSRFLRNEATKPPLTLAITGPWGTGKSSLMNLLRADLRSFGFKPVWFNAWHHQKEEHLLASLLQAVRNQAIPPVWRPEGLVFRAHLLLVRARKHAVKILVLLLVAGAVLASETSGGFHGLDKIAGTLRQTLEHMMDPAQKAPAASLLSQLAALGLSHFAGLGAVATLLIGLYRGLRAFGLNPGALLATAASSIKLADLDAQTSFREKFRNEYSDVAEALGVRTLLIFIDDLDRCQPNQVLDVLEAVNYLVTSGDCFVVFGIDRTRVEPCVALKFKEISAEMSGQDDAAHRREYAIQYLDKLINIEVAVPRLEPADAKALLAPRAEEAGRPVRAEGGEPLRPSRLRQTLAELADILRPTIRLWPFAVAALAFAGGFVIEPRLFDGAAPAKIAPDTPRQGTPVGGESGALVGGASPPPASSGSAPTVPAGTADPLSKVAQEIDAEVKQRPEQLGQFEAALPTRAPLGLLFWAFVLVWGVFLVVQIARLRPELVVKDSDEFVESWRAWYPIIFSRATTPRAIKRFQNRVRFLSMRQQVSDDRPWIRRLIDRLLRRTVDADSPGRAPAREVQIPDPILVVLAAIHLQRGNVFDEFKDAASLASSPDLQNILAVVEAANDDRALEGQRVERWNARALAEDIIKYRGAFVARQSGVRVH